MYRKDLIIASESAEVLKNLELHGVSLYNGIASFVDEHTLHIKGGVEQEIQGDYIIIATGSSPSHPQNIHFDHKRILDSDTILNIKHFPKSLAVLGAGVIGCEYATIFSTMGTKVYLINRTDKILTFIDQEIVRHLLDGMRHDRIELLFNTGVKGIQVPENEKEELKVELDSGAVVLADMFLFAAGRNGNTQDLNLEKVGIKVDNRFNLRVDENYRTSVPNIYAVGDVIGFPALASTSMDQGRVAVAHIFQTRDIEEIAPVLPYGIYTVPRFPQPAFQRKKQSKKGFFTMWELLTTEICPVVKSWGPKKGC